MPPVFQIPKEKPKAVRKPRPKQMPWKVDLWESERGWGRKKFETKEFPTQAKALKFVMEYNQPNVDNFASGKPTPEYYTYAEQPRQC